MPTDLQYDALNGDHVIVDGNPATTQSASGMSGRALAIEQGKWVAADLPEEQIGNQRWAQRRQMSDTQEDRELGRRFDLQSLAVLVGLGRLRDLEAEVRDHRAGTHSVRLTAFDTSQGDRLVLAQLPAYLRDTDAEA